MGNFFLGWIMQVLDNNYHSQAALVEKLSLGGVVSGGLGLFFASMSPELFASWISQIASSAMIIAGLAIVVYQKVEQARRHEFREWQRARSGLGSDDEMPQWKPQGPKK